MSNNNPSSWEKYSQHIDCLIAEKTAQHETEFKAQQDAENQLELLQKSRAEHEQAIKDIDIQLRSLSSDQNFSAWQAVSLRDQIGLLRSLRVALSNC